MHGGVPFESQIPHIQSIMDYEIAQNIFHTHTKINCLFYLLGKQCRSSPHSNLCAPSLPEIRPNLEYERVSYKFVCIEVLYVFYVLYFRVILLPPPPLE